MVTSAVSSANLDVNSIVTQLMQVENRPLAVLQTRQSGLQSKISAYGAIKSAYSAAGDAMAKLSSSIPFNTVKATSSDPASINATASSKAVPGTYSVEVLQLAQAQKLASGLFAASLGIERQPEKIAAVRYVARGGHQFSLPTAPPQSVSP